MFDTINAQRMVKSLLAHGMIFMDVGFLFQKVFDFEHANNTIKKLVSSILINFQSLIAYY